MTSTTGLGQLDGDECQNGMPTMRPVSDDAQLHCSAYESESDSVQQLGLCMTLKI